MTGGTCVCVWGGEGGGRGKAVLGWVGEGVVRRLGGGGAG